MEKVIVKSRKIGFKKSGNLTYLRRQNWLSFKRGAISSMLTNKLTNLLLQHISSCILKYFKMFISENA